jgi:hypothetical protein
MFTKETKVRIASSMLILSVILMVVSVAAILITSGFNGLTPQIGLTVSFALMSLGLFYANFR